MVDSGGDRPEVCGVNLLRRVGPDASPASGRANEVYREGSCNPWG
jgi:hypothetical protein